MPVLTNCDFHRQNIPTAVLTYVQKIKDRIVSVWNEQLVSKSFIA